MARGDVLIYDDGVCGFPGSKRHTVNYGAGTADIKAGELVLKTLGSAYVTKWTVSNSTKPRVGTDYIVGLAASDSTNTNSAKGTVDVFPNLPGMTYLIAPNDTTAFDTQAEYDALVGDRVYLTTTAAGVQTILASDTTTTADQRGNFTGNLAGLIIEPLDIDKYPGKVRFSIHQHVNYTAQLR